MDLELSEGSQERDASAHLWLLCLKVAALVAVCLPQLYVCKVALHVSLQQHGVCLSGEWQGSALHEAFLTLSGTFVFGSSMGGYPHDMMQYLAAAAAAIAAVRPADEPWP
jgi:hypothetical protein